MTEEKFYPVSIAILCNDENGNFTGVAEAFRIGEEILDLDNDRLDAKSPRISFHIKKILESRWISASRVKGKVKIGHKYFEITGYKSSWGNWCWDLVIVSPEIARQIVEYLKELRRFSVDGGFLNWSEKFETDAPGMNWTAEEQNDLEKYGYQKP